MGSQSRLGAVMKTEARAQSGLTTGVTAGPGPLLSAEGSGTGTSPEPPPQPPAPGCRPGERLVTKTVPHTFSRPVQELQLQVCEQVQFRPCSLLWPQPGPRRCSAVRVTAPRQPGSAAPGRHTGLCARRCLGFVLSVAFGWVPTKAQRTTVRPFPD